MCLCVYVCVFRNIHFINQGKTAPLWKENNSNFSVVEVIPAYLFNIFVYVCVITYFSFLKLIFGNNVGFVLNSSSPLTSSVKYHYIRIHWDR